MRCVNIVCRTWTGRPRYLPIDQPGRVSQRCLDVLWFQVWIGIQNLFPFHAFGKQTQDQGDGDAHAPNAGAPALHVGIKGDAIQEAVVSNPP